ncbi:MAG: LytTR family DNA-binding domain-containing protein [Polaribacter sp.]|nr:LytTR family DNA-binding domain-containing protein [Polaribacter sp.]MDG1810935.1 LytTR family DNA-binding domain-containing protein [Polaribacter sp.]MDG1994024.1 LytTR family DNA-binding domain-containing protein [Polaribacter sp.]
MSKKVNCIVVDDEPMAREILVSFIEKVSNLELIKSCKNALEAFEVINSQKIDLLFLDINMPEVSGLSLAKMIGKESKVIFTTAYRDYAVEGFNLKAVDYLLKPIAFDRFLEAVNTFFDTISIEEKTKETSNNVNADFFFVRSERKMVKINFDAILFIESLSDYIKISTNKSVVVTRETITNVEAKLPSQHFLRVHRSYIVSLKSIDSYTNEWVEVNQKAIPISRKYKDIVLKKLKNM